jgi:shikimate kinase / 3-dehydroquinate synthase
VAPFLALTGFMGSGKTSVGSQVASLLGWRFVDLDEAFVEAQSGSIPDFFASEGEAAFRARECEILELVMADDPRGTGLVVALGGGTLESPEAVDMLHERGGVVFLDVDPGQAWARVQGTPRPLARDDESFRALLARRREAYESAASWVLPVGTKSVHQLAEEVVQMVRLAGENWQTLWGRRLTATERSSLVMGGTDALASLATQAASAHAAGSRLFVITDKNVLRAWGETVISLLGESPGDGVFVVEPGEGSKSILTLERCWDWLADRGARRDDVVVALGGGVVGDLAGFAAATYQRGISLWQIPTTLLAQVDSSVGGKTAVDLGAGKNLVGAFYQPDLVVADPLALTTLPHEDYVGGLGEVVKHALLMSPAVLEGLEIEAQKIIDRDLAVVGRMVKESIGYKVSVVEDDERERGQRAALNLGHTVAHAIEVVEGFGSVRHGNAVALGLLVALAVSEELLGLSSSVRERTGALLSKFGLSTTLALPPVDLLLAAMGRDKKVRAGTSGFVGLRAVGDPVWGMDVSREVVTKALEVIKE